MVKSLITAACLLVSALPMLAVDPVDMTIDENMATPAVSSKASPAIVRHMDRIAKTLAKHDIEVRMHRRGEVIDIAVPADRLFAPNDTVLLPTASSILSVFNSLVKLPMLYKMLIIVNSDDAGSTPYSYALTEARAAAIDDYYEQAFPTSELNIIPYGVGHDDPRQPNTSIAGRAANRRVDFIIVPEAQLVDMAKAGKI